MKQLIRTELLKQRTTRTFVAGIVAAPVVASLTTLAIFSEAGKHGNDPLGADSLVQAIAGPASIVTFIALMLGVLAMAGEYRHETITTTFLATPRRQDVVMAKVVAQALAGVAIGTLSMVTTSAIAVPWLHASDVAIRLDADVLRVALGVVTSAALYGAFGVAIGAVIRNQTAAVTVVLTWLLAIEGIIGDIFSGSELVRWLPIAAGRAVVHAGSSGDGLSAPVGAAMFTMYVAVAAAAGAFMTLRRDIT